jgi:hypothetical protein
MTARAAELHPWRKVAGASLSSGRGSFLGPATSRRARWWTLRLACGHAVERTVRYRQLPPAERQRGGTQHRSADDILHAPRRVRCEQCPAES